MVEQIAEIVPGDIFERGVGKEERVFCGPGLKQLEAPVVFCLFDVCLTGNCIGCLGLHAKRPRQRVSVEGAVKHDGQWLSRSGAERTGCPEACVWTRAKRAGDLERLDEGRQQDCSVGRGPASLTASA